MLSSAVTSGADTAFHLPVERAVEELSPEWTPVRPGEFMLNKLFLWARTFAEWARDHAADFSA